MESSPTPTEGAALRSWVWVVLGWVVCVCDGEGKSGVGWMLRAAAVAVGPQLRGGLPKAPWRAAGAWRGFPLHPV